MNHDGYAGDFPSRTEPTPNKRGAALSVQRARPGLLVGVPTGPLRPSVCLSVWTWRGFTPHALGEGMSHHMLGIPIHNPPRRPGAPCLPPPEARGTTQGFHALYPGV